jgi:hypothetical protein
MSLKRIRLELARTPEFPEGNPACGYEFTAPLSRNGLLDAGRWQREKAKCTVRRFWQNAAEERGALVHHRGGAWVFSYGPGEDDDEPIFRFDKHRFKVGEYVSITEHDGIQRPFRVIDVESTS